MEELKAVWNEHPYTVVAAGALALPVAYAIYRRFKSTNGKARKNYPVNTVVLHQFDRGPYAPSMSPFPLKLESYLRIAKIPYINDLDAPFSSKGKMPWITYNGVDVADSQFSIEYLNKKLGIDLNNGLSKEERSVAKAIQVMVDEHLCWTVSFHRWVYDNNMRIVRIAFPYLYFLKFFMKRAVRNVLHGQGIGRHSPEEIKHIMMTDLQALADYLGEKPFMMGQNPTEVDCSVFGMLSQLIWHSSDDVCENLVQEKFPTLHNYCLRFKDKLWPDWDDCITHGGTAKSEK